MIFLQEPVIPCEHYQDVRYFLILFLYFVQGFNPLISLVFVLVSRYPMFVFPLDRAIPLLTVRDAQLRFPSIKKNPYRPISD